MSLGKGKLLSTQMCPCPGWREESFCDFDCVPQVLKQSLRIVYEHLFVHQLSDVTVLQQVLNNLHTVQQPSINDALFFHLAPFELIDYQIFHLSSISIGIIYNLCWAYAVMHQSRSWVALPCFIMDILMIRTWSLYYLFILFCQHRAWEEKPDNRKVKLRLGKTAPSPSFPVALHYWLSLLPYLLGEPQKVTQGC